MNDTMIEHSTARLFGDKVDKALLERFETGLFPAELWQLAVDSGFDMALASEAAGGIGETWTGAWPVMRGIGYWQVPLPLAETMIATMLLSLAGIERPDGPITLIEQGLANTLRASGDGAGLKLGGTVHHVPWARHCPAALVSIAGTGLALVDLHAPGVSITERLDKARTPSDTVSFDGTGVLACAPNPMVGLTHPVFTLGALARSMMMVGALEWLLEQSVQYAGDRVQFGKPIGRNQAIQQPLALMAGDVASARLASLIAARDAPSSTSSDCRSTVFSTAVAKIRSGEAATRGTSIAHQTHGAIGFTYEHRLNFATRRLWSWREDFGADSWWAERLGRAAIIGGSAGFWPGVTERRFTTPIETT